jgi:imidazole glycerol-phosphate synthase subunit HisH
VGTTTVAVVDYGMGNVRSMAKALEHVGADVRVTADEDEVRAAERIVLPGVGAFGEAVGNLRATGLVEALQAEVLEAGKPFLGVCLGMQLLARHSVEHGHHDGLGWLDASVEPIPRDGPEHRIPHTGWNEVELDNAIATPLERTRSGECFYFNHSFRVVPADPSSIVGRCNHGAEIVAALAFGNVFATQFHPEKSQQAGLNLLADFLSWQPTLANQAIRTSTP